MIKFDVMNRFSGTVQFTAEIDCEENESTSIKLGLAVKWAIKARADLADADLAGADLAGAYLAGAYLAGANLADANLAGAYLAGAYLAGANLARAYLAGAYLAGANLAGANLADADLADANLARANLARANLARADLAGAYLADANLAGADLAGANLANQWIVQGAVRSDGYVFMLTNLKYEGVRLKAGCRNFTMAEARQHWKATRDDKPLGTETFAILDCLEAMAKARGLSLDGKES